MHAVEVDLLRVIVVKIVNGYSVWVAAVAIHGNYTAAAGLQQRFGSVAVDGIGFSADLSEHVLYFNFRGIPSGFGRSLLGKCG